MNKAKARKIINSLHGDYLYLIAGQDHAHDLERKFRSIRIALEKVHRRMVGSNNQKKVLSLLARKIFRLQEKLHCLEVLEYSFELELSIMNDYVIQMLKNQIDTKYSAKCSSYGEVFLNCYLDVFFTLTSVKINREIEAKPTFLVNPDSRSRMEIDVMLPELRLGFEFQGKHHSSNKKVKQKDLLKLAKFAKTDRLLIPINAGQLGTQSLQSLISNTMKDWLDLGALLNSDCLDKASLSLPPNTSRYKTVVKSLWISSLIYREALTWLDTESIEYIRRSNSKLQPIDKVMSLRQVGPNGDLSLEYIFQQLSKLRPMLSLKQDV